jgi:hypothetical protein
VVLARLISPDLSFPATAARASLIGPARVATYTWTLVVPFRFRLIYAKLARDFDAEKGVTHALA